MLSSLSLSLWLSSYAFSVFCVLLSLAPFCPFLSPSHFACGRAPQLPLATYGKDIVVPGREERCTRDGGVGGARATLQVEQGGNGDRAGLERRCFPCGARGRGRARSREIRRFGVVYIPRGRGQGYLHTSRSPRPPVYIKEACREVVAGRSQEHYLLMVLFAVVKTGDPDGEGAL